jgi:hypothetical protein
MASLPPGMADLFDCSAACRLWLHQAQVSTDTAVLQSTLFLYRSQQPVNSDPFAEFPRLLVVTCCWCIVHKRLSTLTNSKRSQAVQESLFIAVAWSTMQALQTTLSHKTSSKYPKSTDRKKSPTERVYLCCRSTMRRRHTGDFRQPPSGGQSITSRRVRHEHHPGIGILPCRTRRTWRAVGGRCLYASLLVG